MKHVRFDASLLRSVCLLLGLFVINFLQFPDGHSAVEDCEQSFVHGVIAVKTTVKGSQRSNRTKTVLRSRVISSLRQMMLRWLLWEPKHLRRIPKRKCYGLSLCTGNGGTEGAIKHFVHQRFPCQILRKEPVWSKSTFRALCARL